MEGRSQGITCQHLIAGKITDVTSRDPSELNYRCRPKWYFTRREIEEHSPSRSDGIDSRKEKQLRSLYCGFILDLGMKLRVPQATIATAMMFCHRFYLHQSHAKNDWQTIATVSMFLAGKVEETPRLLADVISVSYEMLNKRDPSATQRIKQTAIYEKQKKLLLIGERLLMATMAFDFNLEHPYKPLIAAIKKLEITHKDVTQVAWNFVNDWLRTSLCLQYKPHYIAAGSLYLAAKFCKVKLPSERGTVWWLQFDVSPHQLEEVIKQMLSLLEDNKRPQMPSSLKKVTQVAVVKKTIANSPESCVLSGSEGTGKSIEDNGQKAGEGGTSRQSSDACARRSQTLPNEDSGIVRNGEESQCQTSDCGSSRSVVEDGNRTDEGEVQPWSEGSQLTTACQIVSDCGVSSRIDVEDGSTDEGDVQPRVEGSHVMAACEIVSDCGGSSRAAGGDGSRSDEGCHQMAASQIVSDYGESSSIAIEDSSRTDGGGVQPRLEDCHQTAVSQIVSDYGESSRIAVDVQPRLEGSHQTAACEVVSSCGGSSRIGDASDSGGLSKIDKDRIKEALRKRKYEKTAHKKVVRTLDYKDPESWIEEELENGIELGSGSLEKRQRL